MKYSKTTGNFFPDDLNYTTLPADIIEVTTDEFNTAMSRNPGDTLDVVSGRIVVVPAPIIAIEQIKINIWNLIKAKRDAVNVGGVLINGYWFHSDNTSRIRYLTLLKIVDSIVVGDVITAPLYFNGEAISWKTMSGEFITMTGKLATDISDAITNLDFTAFKIAEQHKSAMESSVDPANYDFTTNWPVSFNCQ